MNYTKNKKIEQATESTLAIGTDIGSEFNFVRAFDWRGIELTKKSSDLVILCKDMLTFLTGCTKFYEELVKLKLLLVVNQTDITS